MGEARCEQCHPAIFRDSLSSRHTQTYYRGSQLAELPLPDRPLPDPDDPEVTHAFQKRDGVFREETRVGREVFDAVIDYAFGTSGPLPNGSQPRHERRLPRCEAVVLSNARGKRLGSLGPRLDSSDPRHPAGFQGDAIAAQGGLAEVPVLPCDQPTYWE